MVNRQVVGIIKQTQLSIGDINARFFRHFHCWLPVISPRLFREEYECDSREPSADFSILLLAMCLLTACPARTTTLSPPMTLDALYLTTRMLFAQVQALIPASTRLVQAGLLIAAYEYACGRPQAAFISMGTCARMAHSMNLDRNTNLDKGLLLGTASRLKAVEEWNVWWGTVILERVILLELTHQGRSPMTKHPSLHSYLPSDLDYDRCLRALPSDVEPFEDPPRLSGVHSKNVTRFGRQAQATNLLDQVLSVLRMDMEIDQTISELRRLDAELQAFLAIMTIECGAQLGHYCGAMATAIRALVLVHQNILANTETTDTLLHQNSRAALETATKIMVDVAYHHITHLTPHNVDALPLCCSYNLRVAMDHIENQSRHFPGTQASKDLACLMALDRAFCMRWRTS
ncbi:hypothetical protein ASPZODRAFT_135906 [Penicilliopsis zonata CBS 506.65]|uniref:Xylanolytic transcriptional activator regulatory domain-containing protein n=1 Tax=Penicilliopsis zonata CBS 506.65 TaxID=1073090 RepID=A0A1L9S9K9_9EURO|nr:hypothetical protein ASPZODRAFT_135906 [Penicilliopsis zonata CBS 506.65]OJJ43872.1 hypothetical protein ASPZODRAFT_135906 [Penicilliopsis zonata CBS 506.65]